MGKNIPIETNPAAPGAEIEIEASLLAAGFGMEVEAFRRLMNERRITVLCERGIGDDEGLVRATFYFDRTRVRLVVDGTGQPVTRLEVGDIGA